VNIATKLLEMDFFSINFGSVANVLVWCMIYWFVMRESSYCFQRVLAIAILSVCHTGGSVKNGAS